MTRLFWLAFPALLLCQDRFTARPPFRPDIFNTDPAHLDAAHYSVVLDNDHVRVLRFRLGPHERSMIVDVPAHVVVAVTDQNVRLLYPHGKPQERQRKAGDSAWMERDAYGVENVSEKPVEWVLVETRDGKRG
jgi:hypothetical protein